jgi:LPS O-antigen subunit length determinant protein (WzzB/FepE family)
MKKLIIILSVALLMVTGITVAFAASPAKTPAEIVSDVTGKTTDEVTDDRQAGETYCEQAAEAGKLQEFKDERLEQYKLTLDEAVSDKSITQDKADSLYDSMKTRMANCNGDGTGCGQNGCGHGRRSGDGMTNGCGLGNGAGNRNGLGRMDGSCGNCTINN